MYFGFYLYSVIIAHASIIAGHHQNYQLGYMAKVGSIVLVSMNEGEIYYIVHNIDKRNS